VVPTNGPAEPLCAVYAATCIDAVKSRLDAGDNKMTGFYEAVDVRYVEPAEWQVADREGVSFLNVNSEDDLRRAEQALA
jgi:molybdopterin-guanine dinucleotide biosynthesis protein A